MSRIADAFARLRAERRTGLVTYSTIGDPDLPRSAEILRALDRAGADVLEVGVPFSDPLSVAITDTSALPTTAASAKPPISATCSGRETPKPSAIGSDVCARMRRAIASAPDETRSRAPVTPSREMP